MIAYALSLRTPFLLFDEPANGLDIAARHQMRQMMSACVSEEQTVIVATHSIADLENLYESYGAQARPYARVHVAGVDNGKARVRGRLRIGSRRAFRAGRRRARTLHSTAGDCPTAIDYEVLSIQP